jgi:septal ring factor EnvC (AmiA/AmiB activator)
MIGYPEFRSIILVTRYPSLITLGILVLISFVATVLLAIRFKWIQFSLSSEATSRMTRSKKPSEKTESTDDLIKDLQREVVLTQDSLMQHKESLDNILSRLYESANRAEELESKLARILEQLKSFGEKS